MKSIISLIIFIFCVAGYGQSANDYFVQSANQYVNSQLDKALNIVDEGLSKFPNNVKLEALKKKIEEQKKQKSEGNNKNNKNSEQGNQNKQDENSQSPKQDEGENNGDLGTGNSDKKPENNDSHNENMGNPNNGNNEHKNYDYILKALKKQEQKTQRRLMTGANKANLGRKQKDW